VLSWRADLHTRAEIEREELTARLEGLLVPAGEAPVPMGTSHHAAFYAAN